MYMYRRKKVHFSYMYISLWQDWHSFLSFGYLDIAFIQQTETILEFRMNKEYYYFFYISLQQKNPLPIFDMKHTSQHTFALFDSFLELQRNSISDVIIANVKPPIRMQKIPATLLNVKGLVFSLEKNFVYLKLAHIHIFQYNSDDSSLMSVYIR